MAKKSSKGKKSARSKSSGKKTPRKKSVPKKEEAPPAPAPAPQNLCAYHQKPLQYFCENADEPICYDCTVMGPYNTQLHRITSLAEAYDSRMRLVTQAVEKSLFPKRSQLVGQVTWIDYRIQEIQTVKGIIERDIKTTFGSILERLNSAEGKKLAILQHDLSEIQMDVNWIDQILKTLDDLEATPDEQARIIDFLQRYKKLSEEIDYATTKQFKVEIKEVPNDLPRELTAQRAREEEHKEQSKLLKMKDDMIYKLLDEKKKRDEMLTQELDRETKAELKQWMSLTDNFASELKKY